jgi:hypothetical protein
LSLNIGWDADEIYFGKLVNKTGIKVNKIKRGISSNFFTPRRIEKHNFYETEMFKLNLNGFVDLDYFVDCHCARPYSRFKTQIDNLINIILK